MVERYRIDLPPSVAAILADPGTETPKPGDPRLAHARFVSLAGARECLAAAAALCRGSGLLRTHPRRCN